MEGACYGAYFLEVASWLSDENMDGTELLNLLYVSLKALSKEALPNPLVRRIFELRAMVINGVYTQEPEGRVSESCVYAWQYVIATPLGSLYTFTLKEDVLREFSREVQHAMDEYIHHEFKSLEILEVLSGGKTACPVS